MLGKGRLFNLIDLSSYSFQSSLRFSSHSPLLACPVNSALTSEIVELEFILLKNVFFNKISAESQRYTEKLFYYLL